MDASPTPARRTDRFLLGIVAGAVVLVVVGIGAVLATSRSATVRPVDPNSPVGVVQGYVDAVREGDLDRAYGYLSRVAQQSVPLDEYRRRSLRPFVNDSDEQRVLVEAVMVGTDTASVKVTISRFSARPNPFSAGTYHRDMTVSLVREDDGWRISRPVEPYPLY